MSLKHITVPESKEILKKDGGLLKEHRSQPEGVPNDQSWNNLNNKINNDSTGL